MKTPPPPPPPQLAVPFVEGSFSYRMGDRFVVTSPAGKVTLGVGYTLPKDASRAAFFSALASMLAVGAVLPIRGPDRASAAWIRELPPGGAPGRDFAPVLRRYGADARKAADVLTVLHRGGWIIPLGDPSAPLSCRWLPGPAALVT